jgi:hypothetical protein
MKRSALFSLACLALAGLGTAGTALGQQSLFNGKDLSGWEGLAGFWSVEDGAITGKTTADHQPPANTFLVWKGGDVSDFELRCLVKLTPGDEKHWANSGVQFRSQLMDPATFVVGGYQGDIATDQHYGHLYEERLRGSIGPLGEKVVLKDPDAAAAQADSAAKAGKKGGKAAKTPKVKIDVVGSLGKPDEVLAGLKPTDWTDYRIIAKGNHIQLFVNGKLTSDVVDQSSVGAKSGILALQLHRGPAMTVQFKDIVYKPLK